MFDRKLVVRAVVAASSVAAFAACSSAPTDGTSTTDEALVGRCAPPCHWELNEGESRNGGSLKQCVCTDTVDPPPPAPPPSILSVTTPPTPPLYGRDICGPADAVAIPSQLYGKGCSTGMIIDGQPVWACPSPISLPWTPFGVLTPTPPGGACFDDNGNPRYLPCTPDCEVTRVESTLKSNCLGGPKPGWVLVIDGIWSPWCNGGGCAGTCASVRPPVAQ